ncbi:histidine triad nucleotide-binding protein [Psychroflexus sp. MES1-P1E]|uniref:histidine triad nucleotide-binding protein n=1 Tax=Psychroflexus sp. MES1-P1E TaxID=2058320 RepID=UPI000C79ECBA|nr:histidine triad nucleotide-binding protein [Psychroflexus sp. MES1-P1E]PKG41564.1 histidine triad nucleotide-binding protein [Psychroflexus sp. MES1-P1E]
MKNVSYLIILLFLGPSICWSQSSEYQINKAKKIEKSSVFTKIINREIKATIEYENEDIIAFVPLRLQAPVHLLIVPKKEIHTINEVSQEGTLLLGKLFLVAKKLAKEQGISESGYRLIMNINEDAGQSVFHLQLHLLGGKTLGPMVTQEK